MHSNAKIEFLRKHVGHQRYPNSYMDLVLCTPLGIGNPLINDVDKHPLWPCYLLDLKLGM